MEERAKIKLEERWHNPLNAIFDSLHTGTYDIREQARLKKATGFGERLKFDGEGKAVLELSERDKIDFSDENWREKLDPPGVDPTKKKSFLEHVRDRMDLDAFNKWNETMGKEAAQRLDGVTNEVMERAQANTREAVQRDQMVINNNFSLVDKADERLSPAEKTEAIKQRTAIIQSVMDNLFKMGKLGILAASARSVINAIGKQRKGCWMYNVSTGALLAKISDSDNKKECECKGKSFANWPPDLQTMANSEEAAGQVPGSNMKYCVTFCKQQPDAGSIPKNAWSPDSCKTTCPCYSQKTGELQPADKQVGFTFVEGGFFNTLGYLVSAAGAEIGEVVDTGVKLVDSVGKGLAGLFSKWWVILILVLVGATIIIVPTVVTQLPKAKAKRNLGGGSLYGGTDWDGGTSSLFFT